MGYCEDSSSLLVSAWKDLMVAPSDPSRQKLKPNFDFKFGAARSDKEYQSA